MAQHYFGQIPNINHFMSGIMAMNKISAEVLSEIAKEQMKAQQSYLKCQSEHWQNLSHAKGMEEVLSLQAQHLQKISPQMFEHTQHIIDCLLAGAGKCSKIMEEGYQHIQGEISNDKGKMHKEGH